MKLEKIFSPDTLPEDNLINLFLSLNDDFTKQKLAEIQSLMKQVGIRAFCCRLYELGLNNLTIQSNLFRTEIGFLGRPESVMAFIYEHQLTPAQFFDKKPGEHNFHFGYGEKFFAFVLAVEFKKLDIIILN